MNTITNVPAPQESDARTIDFDTFAARAAHELRRQEATQNKHGLRVADLLVETWGKTSVNVDFYEVVGLEGECQAIIQPIAYERVEKDRWEGKKRPCRGQYTDAPVKVTTAGWHKGDTMLPCCSSPMTRGNLFLTTDDTWRDYADFV